MNSLIGVFFFSILLFTLPSHAIILDTNYEAAEDAGFQVAGEVDFLPGTARTNLDGPEKTARELISLCGTSRAQIALIVWSDLEYPTRSVGRQSSAQVLLALARGAEVKERLLGLAEDRGKMSFDIVNMAERSPHPLGRVRNIKRKLEILGAAPSDPFEMGLFGENAQRNKAVVWVHCERGDQPARSARARSVQIVQWRGNLPQFSEITVELWDFEDFPAVISLLPRASKLLYPSV